MLLGLPPGLAHGRCSNDHGGTTPSPSKAKIGVWYGVRARIVSLEAALYTHAARLDLIAQFRSQ